MSAPDRSRPRRRRFRPRRRADHRVPTPSWSANDVLIQTPCEVSSSCVTTSTASSAPVWLSDAATGPTWRTGGGPTVKSPGRCTPSAPGPRVGECGQRLAQRLVGRFDRGPGETRSTAMSPLARQGHSVDRALGQVVLARGPPHVHGADQQDTGMAKASTSADARANSDHGTSQPAATQPPCRTSRAAAPRERPPRPTVASTSMSTSTVEGSLATAQAGDTDDDASLH